MKNKSLFLTLCISLFLFTFIIILIYCVYSFAYYDKNEEFTYLNIFNKRDFSFVYEHLDNEVNKSKDDFNIPINLMYNKNNLKNIYYLYYKNDSIFSGLEEFINTYYYGDILIDKDNIVFLEEGKTNLVSRRTIKYQSIELSSKNNYKVSLGLKKDINLKVEDSASIILDDKEVACKDNICNIDYIFGGLHTIKYKSNGTMYFSLISIKEDEEVIDIGTIDSLIKIDNKDNSEVVNEVDKNNNALLKIGTYKISECYLEASCASKKKSFLTLNEDGSVNYYLYISFEVAGDNYVGTYKIQGNFLILSFKSHTYSVHDYDTGQTTNIEAQVDVEIRFKIDNSTTLSNDSYQFKYSA